VNAETVDQAAVADSRCEALPTYRVRARNTSVDSENKIHDDGVAVSYGFRGGLVPGVTVYGYMTVPLVQRLGLLWLRRGSMQVKFHQPFYEGETVLVHGELSKTGDDLRVALRAEKEDGVVCATALASVDERSGRASPPEIESYAVCGLPKEDARLDALTDLPAPGSVLGTLHQNLQAALDESNLLAALDERLPIYFGADAVAHPALLLGLANQALVRNYKLGPWIHAGSDLTNWDVARNDELVSVRGRISDRFDRKGHSFVVLDLVLIANDDRLIQQVRHNAIYRPRVVER
jgi:hypothetical protein